MSDGFCECGCGEKTPIAKISSARAGWIRGEPIRFIHGHNFRIGNLNGLWKGEDASYGTLHDWLSLHYPRKGRCESCGATGRTEHAFLRHPEKHTRNRDDYRELCVPCHRRMDICGHPTNCKRGHNDWKILANGQRQCKACRRARYHERKAAV